MPRGVSPGRVQPGERILENPLVGNRDQFPRACVADVRSVEQRSGDPEAVGARFHDCVPDADSGADAAADLEGNGSQKADFSAFPRMSRARRARRKGWFILRPSGVRRWTVPAIQRAEKRAAW